MNNPSNLLKKLKHLELLEQWELMGTSFIEVGLMFNLVYISIHDWSNTSFDVGCFYSDILWFQNHRKLRGIDRN
jgi:hypothetical protein